MAEAFEEGTPGMTAKDFIPVRAELPNSVRLAVIGAISGGLSWLLIDASDSGGLKFDLEGYGVMVLPIAVHPGLVFGLLVGSYLRLRTGVSWLRAIGYVLAAGLAYFAAFHVAFYILNSISDDGGQTLAYVVGGVPAGLVGSLLLGLATKYLLRARARLAMGLPVAVGTVNGALLVLGNFADRWGFLAFFVLWQAAYGASLAPLLRARSV
jgi:hypothetical protein